MSLLRHARETQRAFVERTLREEGRIATYDALYNACYDDGRKTSVTRLAAIIHTLRGDGWRIATHEPTGGLAVYTVEHMPRPANVWACTVCARAPADEPLTLLGGLGQAYCLNCGRRQTFRKAA